MQKLQILSHKYHIHKVSLQCVVLYAHSFLGCETFATKITSIRPPVYVDSFMSYQQISSLEILGTKMHTKKASYACEYIKCEVP